MFCYSCGNQLSDGVKFCPACGAKQNMNGQTAVESQKKIGVKQRVKLTQRASEEIAKVNASELFSNRFSTKCAELLNVQLKFPGSFFLKQYTYDFFSGKIKTLGDEAEKILRNVNFDEDNIESYLKDAVINGYKGCEVLEEFAESIGLADEALDDVTEQYQMLIGAIEERMDDIGKLFDRIDAGVDDVMLRNEYRKVTRPRVESFGFGIKGLAKAVVTQSILNGGIGLAYDVVNNIDVNFAEKQAREKKANLLESCIKIIRDFFSEGDQAVAAMCLEVIEAHWPGAVWTRDDQKIEELKAAYASAENGSDRRGLGVQLLQSDPFDRKAYERCFALVEKEPLEKQSGNVRALEMVASWFSIDLQAQKEEYFDRMAAGFKKTYPVDDMRRYDLLLQLEPDASSRSKSGTQLMREYASYFLVNRMRDYSIDNIELILEKIEEFEKKYGYDAQKEKATLTQKIPNSSEIDIDDMRRYDLLLRLEPVAKCRSSEGTQILRDYASHLVDSISNCPEDNIVSVAGIAAAKLDQFAKKYGYDAKDEKTALVRLILENKKIEITDEKSIDTLKSYIEECEHIKSAIPELHFYIQMKIIDLKQMINEKETQIEEQKEAEKQKQIREQREAEKQKQIRERKEAEKMNEKAAKRKELEQRRDKLQQELDNLRGLFVSHHRSLLRKRLNEICGELEKLT